jgi:molybdopterin/thiamine biosynthesis adenylyltransferase
MMQIVIVGLGGIGSILVQKLCRFLYYSHEEAASIALVDGDTYEPKNYERQEFINLGPKAETQARELSSKYPDIEFVAFNEYVTEENIGDIIINDSIIFLCVDNHKSRKLISEYCKELENVTLISGGNDFTDGNAQIYIRERGSDKTPDLCAYHPEIANPEDRSPHEMSCEELSRAEPQLYFANLGAATLMCWAFYNTVIKSDKTTSEAYFDLRKMSIMSYTREVKK